MTSRRFLPLSIYLVALVCLPVLAQKTAIDPALLTKANAGDAQAQLTLGEAYLSGICRAGLHQSCLVAPESRRPGTSPGTV